MLLTKPLLLSALTFLTPSNANQIRFFRQASCNASTPFRGCDRIGPPNCCTSGGLFSLAVSVSKTPLDIALTYYGGGCSRQLCDPSSGGGIFCCVAGFTDATGATFYEAGGKGEEVYTKCTSEMSYNIIGLSDGTDGNSVLSKEHLGEEFEVLSAEFDEVDDAAKLEWLQAHGGVYEKATAHAWMHTEVANGVGPLHYAIT